MFGKLYENISSHKTIGSRLNTLLKNKYELNYGFEDFLSKRKARKHLKGFCFNCFKPFKIGVNQDTKNYENLEINFGRNQKFLKKISKYNFNIELTGEIDKRSIYRRILKEEFERQNSLKLEE